jgi:hypothetical protein
MSEQNNKDDGLDVIDEMTEQIDVLMNKVRNHEYSEEQMQDLSVLIENLTGRLNKVRRGETNE